MRGKHTSRTIESLVDEAKKLVQGGGVSLNKQKVTDASFKVDLSLFVNEKYLFVQKGKKDYYLVKI